MLTGVVIGLFFRNYKFTQKTEKTIHITIISLLFILGLSIGANDEIIRNLYDYGSQAAILAIFSLTGSISTSWLVYRTFFKNGGKR